VRVHVAFTPGEQTPAPVGIVVDVLRATSTMTQALAAGYRRVLCCGEIDEARTLATTEGPAKLAGERRLEHIEGFDFGNSPSEVAGQPAAETLILSTTNGTRLLVDAAARFERVYVGSLLNLDAVVRAAHDSATVAIRLAHSFGSALEGLGASWSAANLRRHGLEADLEWCARESVLDVAPRFVRMVGAAAEVTL
jgi:phosphosulfolactate phosphohydrolase-like enzyme